MAALRLGVGDLFTLCQVSLGVCATTTTHYETVESQRLIAEIKLMKGHLKSLENKIGNEHSFSTARPDIAPVIKRSLEPLHKDLSRLHELLCERQQEENNQFLQPRSRNPSIHVLDQIREQDKLESFHTKLPRHRDSLTLISELIDQKSSSERRASCMRLQELVAKLEGNDQQGYFPADANSLVTPTANVSYMTEEEEAWMALNGPSPMSMPIPTNNITEALQPEPKFDPSKAVPRRFQRPTFNLNVFQHMVHPDNAGTQLKSSQE